MVVNLIPFNDIGHPSYIRPLRESILEFQRVLIDKGVFTFIRTTREDDESVACGQLATNNGCQYEVAERATWLVARVVVRRDTRNGERPHGRTNKSNHDDERHESGGGHVTT